VSDVWEHLRQVSAAAPADRSVWQVSLPTREILGQERPPVGGSPDLNRVASLPRRDPPALDGVEGAALVELAVRRWGRGPRSCACASMGRTCITRPFPIQAWALHEASLVGGLLAPIVVGGGKTFLDIMVAMAVPGCRQAVLLIPPGLREQLRREYLAIAEHFHVPSIVMGEWGAIQPGRPVVHVVAYSQFSRPESTDILERLAPDLVVADEAHKLRHRETATVGRVLRYWVRHPGTRLCAWSGTLTARSLRDFAHLAALSLRTGSPLPLDPAVVEEWALAVDPSDWPSPPGKLGATLGLPVRRGLHRRIVETLGVVSSTGSATNIPMRILERVPPDVPAAVGEALNELRLRWVRPDGEELVEMLEVARSAQELACGFFYRWKFPHGEPEWLILEWFAARKEWHRELRHRLATRSAFMDSPFLCTQAAMRAWGDLPPEAGRPTWKATSWPRWRDVRDRVHPESEAVWIDDWLAQDAADWARGRRGVVWYRHGAFGARVAALAGLPRHGGGPGAETRILAERGDRGIVASIKAHGTGRDGLQKLFSEQLVANPPASGAEWEQLLGRLDRPGQRAAEVVTWVYRHAPELADAVDAATAKACYIQEVLHGAQKLLRAQVGFPVHGGLTGDGDDAG